jgi:hypothetical protein
MHLLRPYKEHLRFSPPGDRAAGWLDDLAHAHDPTTVLGDPVRLDAKTQPCHARHRSESKNEPDELHIDSMPHAREPTRPLVRQTVEMPVNSAGSSRWGSGVIAAQLSEGEATLRVALAAGGLALLGVVLLVATLWWWRSTRPEPPVLGPLVMMDDRAFRASDPRARQLILDAARLDRSPVDD